MESSKSYIFSEAYGCGLILKKCLESFFKYHPNTIVNIFGTVKDFKEMGKFKNVEYIELSDDDILKECFKHGHLGTAHIGTRVIKEFSDSNFIIHFDSDVIFRKECLSLLYEKIDEGYDLIGPRRCYKNNLNGRKDLSNIKDVTQTYFYAFNKEKIGNYDFSILRSMVVGHHNPLNHPILDYFDPVAFDILKNGGKIFFLDPELVGAQFENGSKENKYKEVNSEIDLGDNLAHFAGIGSGMKFYYQGTGSVPLSYADWAKERFAIYYKIFFNKDLENVKIDLGKYKMINKYFLDEANS